MSHHASPGSVGNRLDRAVNPARDHVLGPPEAEITLVEYGSYDCQFCRTANNMVKELRDRFGERMRYVFRHRPIPGSDIARRAAELIETAPTPDAFWRAHVTLMTRSARLTEADLEIVAADLAEAHATAEDPRIITPEQAAIRVEEDEQSAARSGVRITPTFFINGKRYGSVWEESALADAMLGSLGHRVAAAAVDFARWAPSAGLMLVIATILALVISNTSAGPSFLAFWDTNFSLGFGDRAFSMPLVRWVNDGLLSIFFLVVGLEIKREFTSGHLSTRRSAALPVAAALGGMLGPILVYLAILPDGPWSHGWGVPMATDTAFAVALIIMMGDRVPIELRVFLTAATIIDDIGAILVVAGFYSESVSVTWLAISGGLTTFLFLLNRFGIYRVTPYLLTGAVLWFAIHEAGLHATLAGVILALFIPAREPANLETLRAQGDAILTAEARAGGEVLRSGPSERAMQALELIQERLESPADRVLRRMAVRSNYVVLPVFAFANAGVVISSSVFAGHEPLMLATTLGLVVGKPLGMTVLSLLAVWIGLASKPDAYGWRQVLGAGALSGIGFTMSLFIASQAFPIESDFAAAKIAVFIASVLSAFIGVGILWRRYDDGNTQSAEAG